MRISFYRTICFFICGIFIGKFSSNKLLSSIFLKERNLAQFGLKISDDGLYNESLSNFLFQEVKVLCMILTYPANHQTKIAHLKYMWAKRCNKLVVLSDEEDPDLGIEKLDVTKGREFLWEKTISGFRYVRTLKQ